MITRGKFDPTILKDILQIIPVGLVAISSTGRVESWNPAAERILGWSSDDVAGGSPPIDLPVFPTSDLEIHRRRKNGTPVDLQVQVIPWKDSSGTEHDPWWC